ncbi:hypothetical protein [Agromyces arachidis]|uniref:hypothetical protein n=1 Tax=Agromyces arachidis TaxID=766966 RepID=UPI004055D456
MENRRITDDEAAALLGGRTPHAREELFPLAAAVAEFRRSSFGTPPRPSPAVASRLDLERLSGISYPPEEHPNAAPTLSMRSTAPRSRRRRVAFEWFAGLGLAGKIAIAASAAAAVGVGGAGAAGAVGALPEPAQVMFEQVTGAHPGGEHVSESGLEHSEKGLETAEEARQNGEEHREAGLEKAAEQAQQGLETAGEKAGAGLETAEEKASTGAEASDGAAGGGAEQSTDAGDRGAETADEKAGDAKDGAGH